MTLIKQVCCLVLSALSQNNNQGLFTRLCPLSALSENVTELRGQLLIPLLQANIYFLYFRVRNDKRFVI